MSQQNNDLTHNANDEPLRPAAPAQRNSQAEPNRQFIRVRMSIPHDLTLTTPMPANNLPTNLEPAPDSSVQDDLPPSYEFEKSTPELTPDVNSCQDNQVPAGLDVRKMRAAVALSVGQTETQAARLVGVNRTTIYRWHQDPEFVAEVNRLQREHLAEQRARLRTLLNLGVTTLESCLERKDMDVLKLRAAMFVVSQFAPRAHETIGPLTERGVKKLRKDEAMRLSTSAEVHLLRVTEP